MVHEVVLPEVGDGVTEAFIVEWHKAVGDPIAGNEPLVEVMTDKVNVTIEADVSGTVRELRFEPEARAPIGAVLAVIEA